MKPVVMLVRLCVDGRHQAEIAEFVAWAAQWQLKNPHLCRDLLIPRPLKGIVPATCARNRAVAWAREHRADVLMMLDDDMILSPEFFASAVKFLAEHHGPAAVGVPYCCAPPSEDVLVFEWAALESGAASAAWKLNRIGREDAARRSGIERVANIGTGCIAYDMRCFDAYEPPYYDYSYGSSEKVEVVETEDCYAHRHMSGAGVKIYCDWDHWGGHVKAKLITKPAILDQKFIDRIHVREAKAELHREALIPRDVEGLHTDMGDAYARAVDEARDGAGFVEVGCWKGASTILLAKLIRLSGKRIELVAVDTWEGSPDEEYHRRAVRAAGGPAGLRAEFEENLARHAVADLVTICQQVSPDAARTFRDGAADFVYIDAQHSCEAVEADIRGWLPKVRPGGVLAGHDVDFPGVRVAVENLLPGFVVIGRSWWWRKPTDGAGEGAASDEGTPAMGPPPD